MNTLSSRDNPHFKRLKKLIFSARARRKNAQIVLDGLHLIEVYQARFGWSGDSELIISEHGAAQKSIADYLMQTAQLKIKPKVMLLCDVLFNELACVEAPSGIMAITSQPLALAPVSQTVDSLLLDGVQDPGNLGSILRSAAAAGFRQILLSSDCAQAWSPKSLRAGMGAHFQLDIHERCDLIKFLDNYAGKSIVTALNSQQSLYETNLQGSVAWVFGCEGQGVRPTVLAATDCSLCIPMPGGMESLNVAAAAAICLFETVRQRNNDFSSKI
ncbi:MAG: RNA methyltransferase [Pseudomonadota bacterium]